MIKSIGFQRVFAAASLLFFLQMPNAHAQLYYYGTAGGNESFRNSLVHNGYYYVGGVAGSEGTLSCIRDNTSLPLQWTRQYGAPGGQSLLINDIAVSLSGNILLAGISRTGTSWNFNQIFVLEVSQANGDVLQSKFFNLSSNGGDHRFSSVKIETVPDTGGCPGVYFLHARRANGGDAIDETFLAKLDYGLNALWAKIYNDGVSEWETYNLVADANGDVIISGLSTLGSRYGTLTKIDGANGLVLASNGYQTAGTGVLFLNVLRERTAAGTPNFVVVGGYTSPNTNNYIGGIAKINATTWAPSWSKQFEKTGEQVLFTGLAQLQANNGDLYTGYFTPDPANPGFFKPRLLRVASGNGTFKKYRDLGGLNTGLASDYLQIGANGAARLFNTTGRPGTIGGDDGYLYELGSTMIDACGTTITQATVNMPLTKTALPLDVFDVLQQVVVSNYCSPSTPVWGQDQPPCPPHGNKPANGEGQNNTLTRNPDLDLLEQVLSAPSASSLALNPAPSPISRASSLGFEIFPNPAAETLEITLDLNEETPETEQLVQIFDAMGRLVKTQTAITGEQTTLDLGDLPKGIYSVKVGDSPAQKLTKM